MKKVSNYSLSSRGSPSLAKVERKSVSKCSCISYTLRPFHRFFAQPWLKYEPHPRFSLSTWRVTKVILFTLLLASINSNLTAANFFVGGIMDSADTAVTTNLTYPLDYSPITTAHTVLSLPTFGAGLTAGYWLRSPASVFGLNAYADMTWNEGSNTRSINNWFNTTTASVKIAMPRSTAFATLLSIQIQPRLVVLLGPTIAETTFESYSAYTGGNIAVTGDYKTNFWGWGGVLGMIYSMTPHWDLRVTDNYIVYPSITWTAEEPISGSDLAERYQLSSNILQASVIFNF